MIGWAELYLEKSLRTVSSADMKRSKAEKGRGEDHVVPLPSHAIELLNPLTLYNRSLAIGFTADRNPRNANSDNSVRNALISLDFLDEHSLQCFRASAKSMLVDEVKDLSQISA